MVQLPPQVIDRGGSRQGEQPFAPEGTLTTRGQPAVELAFRLADCAIKQIAGPLSDQARARGQP